MSNMSWFKCTVENTIHYRFLLIFSFIPVSEEISKIPLIVLSIMVLIISSRTNYQTLWIFECIQFMSAQFMYYV